MSAGPHVSRTKDRRDQKRPLQALARRFACKTRPALSQRANARKLVSESSQGASNRPCSLLTMSNIRRRQTAPANSMNFPDQRTEDGGQTTDISCRPSSVFCHPSSGGARRDRTDDLKLAKLALSQLSY